MAKTNTQTPSVGSVGVIKTGDSPNSSGHGFVVIGVSADGSSVDTMEADGSNG